MKAKKPERTYQLVPAGNHVARLYSIIHLGTTSFEYMGEQKKSDKVRLTFELCNERTIFKDGEEPKPYSISREFGLSMGQKSHLRPFVEGLIGTTLYEEEAYNFDLEDLIGRACLLNVVHTEKGDKVYSNIKGASPLPRGMEAPELFNKTAVIDVDTASFEEIDALPEFLRDKMKASEEYQARVRHSANMEGTSTDERGDTPGKTTMPPKPRVLGGPKDIEGEYPAEDINPDDIPF